MPCPCKYERAPKICHDIRFTLSSVRPVFFNVGEQVAAGDQLENDVRVMTLEPPPVW
jgi:hypothetical protein